MTVSEEIRSLIANNVIFRKLQNRLHFRRGGQIEEIAMAERRSQPTGRNGKEMKSRFVLFCAALILGGYVLAPMAFGQGVGYLKANIDPGRAGVFVDGRYLGPATNFGIARKYALSPGEHQLRLIDPRYEELSTTVEIREGKETSLWEELKPLPAPRPPFGTLRVICPDKFAAVYLNGRFYGHADEFNNLYQGLLLNPGEYEVRIVPTAGGTLLAWMKARITEGTTTTVWTKEAER